MQHADWLKHGKFSENYFLKELENFLSLFP